MKILITNQHTNNRGDESASRAMIYGLKKAFKRKKLKFTIMKQDEKHEFLNDKDVQEIGMVNNVKGLLLFNCLLLLHKLGLKNFIKFFQGKTVRKFKSYIDADLVISAPGGPYFGDIYSGHEVVHLYHTWVAKFLKKPLILYAPSAGPFKRRIFNPLRKYVIKKFDLIIVRDPISRRYLESLLPNRKFYVTADSCLQHPIKHSLKKKNLVGITLWGYQTRKKSKVNLEKYKKIMAIYCDYLSKEYRLKIVFLPQLFGKNSDMELIKSVVNLMSYPAEIFPPDKNSTAQQKFVSSLKMVVGARYHSVIFSAKNKIPFIPIYYEHKTKGFIKMLGFEDLLIKIDDINLNLLKRKTKKLIKKKKEIKRKLDDTLSFIQKKSFYSSLLTRDCYYFIKDKSKQNVKLEDFLSEKYDGDRVFKSMV